MRLVRSGGLRTLLALLILGLAVGWTARGDDQLAAVYSAVLRGDPDGGQVELERLRAQGVPEAELARVEGWLDAFRSTVASRQDMTAKTFAWNVEGAKKALSAHELYFALSFAYQARPYAPDEAAFAAEPWVEDLTAQAKAKILNLEAEQRWPRVLAYYRALEGIRPDDKSLEALREDAGRHARLELVYKDQAALDKRIQGVDKHMLSEAIRLIDKNYYQEPDFKRMAEGAVQNLITLADTKKLHEFLHGLGNPETRAYFISALRDLEQGVRTEERFAYKDLLKLYNRVALVNTESVELPEGLLVVEFMEGALQRLDPFTAVIWPVDKDSFDKAMMGDFVGVGIQLSLDERTSRLKVVTPLEDSPALEAGVQPDDLIIEVDGKTTKGWTTDEAVKNITGKLGTDVELTIFRPSTGERQSFKLTRRKIVLRTVRGFERKADDAQSWNYMVDDTSGIAYLRLTDFHPESPAELVAALKTAQSQGMRGLILDVRYNPGGLLDSAVDIVSMFLREGQVVSTGGRSTPKEKLPVTQGPYVVDVPLVVLTNDGSASASEILAGALQDQNRAIILGERTYGKGSVQRLLSIGKDARLKLTTSLYYLPSGRSPHKELNADKWGVDPNWEVKLTPKEFRRIIKHENESMVIHNEARLQPAADQEGRDKKLAELKADEPKDDDEPPLLTDEQIKTLENDPVPARDADPQMETALLLLRAKLAANLPWPPQLAAKTADAKP